MIDLFAVHAADLTQSEADRQMAARLTSIAADLLGNGKQATVGLMTLLGDIRDRDPSAFEAFTARVTLSRLGLPTGPDGRRD